jgi:hypothetical protein
MAVEPIKADQLVRLYAPVGQIVVLWGLTDVTVSHIGLLMMKVMGTPQDAHHWPIMFGKRLAILEKNFKKRPEFAEMRDFGLQMIKVLREMTHLRDMLIHGNPIRYDKALDALVFQRIDPLTQKQKKRAKSPLHSHRTVRMRVRFSTLEDAADRCVLINSRLISIRDRLRAL